MIATDFDEIKKNLSANSSSLSDKLEMHVKDRIKRSVDTRLLSRVEYALTRKVKKTVLLDQPLLYYSSDTEGKVFSTADLRNLDRFS